MPPTATLNPPRTEEEALLFRSLDTNHDGRVSRKTIEQVLRISGVDPHQSQLAETFDLINALPEGQQGQLDLETFSRCIKPNISLFTRVVKGELVIPDFHLFGNEIETIFRDCRSDTSGANADYIPQLRDAESERFGLSIFTVDGQQLHYGDCDETFSAQSTTKTINYCLAV